ncbi:MAG TPA: hypothetical protein VFZ34_17405 [Blastocatellia bacterium]|nr:hypothetical protein [Blastocatellia bacterium]
MMILVLMFLTILSGASALAPQTTVPQSQPPRPIIFPEAKPIRPLPPSSIEPAPAVTTSLPNIDVRRGMVWGITKPSTSSAHIHFQDGKFTSLVIVQPEGDRRSMNKEELKQYIESQQPAILSPQQGIIVENGAVFIKTGSFIIPMTGGGASGCFGVTPERNEQIQKEVRLQFEKEKSEKEKK